MSKSGYDNNPNSIFRASRTVKKIINKNLKKIEDAKLVASQDQGSLKPTQSSNLISDIDKNFSLFTLNLKQVAILMDTIVGFVNASIPKARQLDIGHMTIKEINDLNANLTPEDRELLGGSRKGKKSKKKSSSRNISSDSSYIDPFTHSRNLAKEQRNVVRSSQLNPAPVIDEEEYEQEDEPEENIIIQHDSDPDDPDPDDPDPDDPDPDDPDPDDPDVSELSESDSESDSESNKNRNKNRNNINLSREIARISNSIQHLLALWDDYISPNILYLSKKKLDNFLNSNVIKNFRHSLSAFKLFSHVIDRVYPAIEHIYMISIQEADELLISVIRDIKRVSGINVGTSSDVDRATERTITGAGFLHFPSPYNNYMHHTRTKYLM
jgi:hypothetical protein